jgi:hypothetical protein
MRWVILSRSVPVCPLIKARRRMTSSRLWRCRCGELAEALAALAQPRAELGRARERITELEDGIPLSSGTKAEAGPQRAAPCNMRSSDPAHSGRHFRVG